MKIGIPFFLYLFTDFLLGIRDFVHQDSSWPIFNWREVKGKDSPLSHFSFLSLSWHFWHHLSPWFMTGVVIQPPRNLDLLGILPCRTFYEFGHRARLVLLLFWYHGLDSIEIFLYSIFSESLLELLECTSSNIGYIPRALQSRLLLVYCRLSSLGSIPPSWTFSTIADSDDVCLVIFVSLILLLLESRWHGYWDHLIACDHLITFNPLIMG